MAAATVVKKNWGYRISGGTDNTVISSGKVRACQFQYVPGASAASAILYNNNAEEVHRCKGTTAGVANNDATGFDKNFGDSFMEYDGLNVTLSNAGNVLYIYTR